MNLFQWLTLPALAAVVVLDLRGLASRRGNMTLRIVRIIAWMMAALLIAQPTLTSTLSRQLGIGRGTDLMVYLFMLASPMVWFRMQAQTHALQRKVSELARIEAIRTATHSEPHDSTAV